VVVFLSDEPGKSKTLYLSDLNLDTLREADIHNHYDTDHFIAGRDYFFPGILAKEYDPA
jgi:hypothetical protein